DRFRRLALVVDCADAQLDLFAEPVVGVGAIGAAQAPTVGGVARQDRTVVEDGFGPLSNRKLGRHPDLGAATDGGQQEAHPVDLLGGEAPAARPAAFPQRIHAEACATGCAAGALRGRPGPRRCNPDPSSATTDGYLISVRSTPGMRTTS